MCKPFLAIKIVVWVSMLLLLVADGSAFAPPFAESQFQVVDGVMLHYRLWEPEEEPQGQVLLVHGLGGSTFSWRYTAPFLQEQGYRVAAVDLPGFGYSDRQRGLDHSQQNRARLLWRLLDRIADADDKDGCWHLVGHSMGGGTITAMAHFDSDCTATLSYAAGAVYQRPPGAASFFASLPVIRSVVAWVVRVFLLTENRLASALESAYGRVPNSAELKGYLTPLQAPGTEHMLLDITASRGEPVSQYLGSLRQPALLLWGAEDTWVPVEEARDMLSELPRARLIVEPKAAHCPMETAPAWFNHHLLDHLQEAGAEQNP